VGSRVQHPVVRSEGHDGPSIVRKGPSLVLSRHDERGHFITRNVIATRRVVDLFVTISKQYR